MGFLYYFRDAEVAGSNPVISTISNGSVKGISGTEISDS